MSLEHCDFRLHDVMYLFYCHMQETNISYITCTTSYIYAIIKGKKEQRKQTITSLVPGSSHALGKNYFIPENATGLLTAKGEAHFLFVCFVGIFTRLFR